MSHTHTTIRHTPPYERKLQRHSTLGTHVISNNIASRAKITAQYKTYHSWNTSSATHALQHTNAHTLHSILRLVERHYRFVFESLVSQQGERIRCFETCVRSSKSYVGSSKSEALVEATSHMLQSSKSCQPCVTSDKSPT